MKHQKGLSLVELMVALGLSSILMYGVLQIFISNKKTFEVSHDLGLMQESGRIAMSMISSSTRMADHWVGLENKDVKTGSITLSSAPSGCAGSFVFDTDFPLRGYEGASTLSLVADFPSFCLDAADYQPNTDILVLRYADSRENFSDSELVALPKRVFVRSITGDRSEIFQGNDAANMIAKIPSDKGVSTFAYQTDVYFIRPCSLKVSGVCQDDIPTLVRLTLSEDRFEQQVLIDGIEQLQFEYGIDDDGDLEVDVYSAAKAIGNTSDDWANVVSVRVSLLARSSERDNTVDDTKNADGTNKEYLLVGDMATPGAGFKVATADANYRRKQYQREIYVRNRGIL